MSDVLLINEIIFLQTGIKMNTQSYFFLQLFLYVHSWIVCLVFL